MRQHESVVDGETGNRTVEHSRIVIDSAPYEVHWKLGAKRVEIPVHADARDVVMVACLYRVKRAASHGLHIWILTASSSSGSLRVTPVLSGEYGVGRSRRPFSYTKRWTKSQLLKIARRLTTRIFTTLGSHVLNGGRACMRRRASSRLDQTSRRFSASGTKIGNTSPGSGLRSRIGSINTR